MADQQARVRGCVMTAERFPPGTWVRVFGLGSKNEKWNGLEAEVLFFIEDKGRYRVQIKTGKESNLKGENVQRLSSAAPKKTRKKKKTVKRKK